MRNFLSLFYGCILLCTLLVTGSCAASSDPVRNCVVSIASLEVGTVEVGKNNHGPEVAGYLKAVGLKEGYAYCGAFIVWVYKQCGQKAPKLGAQAPAWFTTPSRLVVSATHQIREPRPGDVAGYMYPNFGRFAHVAIVEKWPPTGMVTTIEGNTGPSGGRDGHGVWRKRRLRKQIHSVADWLS